MTAGAINVHDGRAVNGWVGRRPSVIAERRTRDAARLLVAIALAMATLLGVAGLAGVGSVGMPPQGPGPGLDL